MQATPEEKALWQQRIDLWRESGMKQSVWCRWKKMLSFRAEKEGHPKINSQGQRLLKRQHLFQ